MVSYGLAHQAGLKASANEDSGLVLATGKGTPLDTQNIINRHFKLLLASAGLPSIRLDDLQHTCFTILLARGTHLKYVQDLAGHASIHLHHPAPKQDLQRLPAIATIFLPLTFITGIYEMNFSYMQKT